MIQHITVPSANLNGTSIESLRDDRIAMRQALRAAIGAIRAGAPHVRDYAGSNGNSSYPEARSQHERRLMVLDLLLAEIGAEMLALNQGEGETPGFDWTQVLPAALATS